MVGKENQEGVVKTNPDPTEAVKEALTLAIRNLDDKISIQLKSVDDATRLAREELKSQLESIVNAVNEKFIANKDLVDQLAKANAVALSAALQTQKESAAKSEVGVGDLLKQMQVAFDASSKSTNEKIDRLTSRLDTGEGVSSQRDPAMTLALEKLNLTMAAVTASQNSGQGASGQAKQDFTQAYMLIIVIGILAGILIPFLHLGH
jgi:nucleosome binding factor SPN SPT16 subunit